MMCFLLCNVSSVIMGMAEWALSRIPAGYCTRKNCHQQARYSNLESERLGTGVWKVFCRFDKVAWSAEGRLVPIRLMSGTLFDTWRKIQAVKDVWCQRSTSEWHSGDQERIEVEFVVVPCFVGNWLTSVGSLYIDKESFFSVESKRLALFKYTIAEQLSIALWDAIRTSTGPRLTWIGFRLGWRVGHPTFECRTCSSVICTIGRVEPSGQGARFKPGAGSKLQELIEFLPILSRFGVVRITIETIRCGRMQVLDESE